MNIRWIFVMISLLLLISPNVQAGILFSDHFDSGAKSDWGNEVGMWDVIGGEYRSTLIDPNQYPLYSISSVTTLPSLTNFIVDVDLLNVAAGGLLLRSPDLDNGLVLTFAGEGGTYDGLYWHILENGIVAPQTNRGDYPGLIGSNSHLKVEVFGNDFKAYLNNDPSPITSFHFDRYSSGLVALYQADNQFLPNDSLSFDNFVISDTIPVTTPEPVGTTLFLLGGTFMMYKLARKRGRVM